MAERLKDRFFTEDSMAAMADTLKEEHAPFDREQFLRLTLGSQAWEGLELKARMRHTTKALHECLPSGYREALDILERVAPNVGGFEAMCLPDYVELYGMEDWDRSLPAMALFTRRCSSEFAIRPFLIQDQGRAIRYLEELAHDQHENVRRFASEGCRPRLPWAMALPALKQDPRPILPILEKLKDDPSEFVRRSVANNLNDISKDNPELMLEVAERWRGHSPETDWILKHGCRTLLKAGVTRALVLFGFGDPAGIYVDRLRLPAEQFAIGDTVPFEFDLRVEADAPARLRVEYVVTYAKARGRSSQKVFQVVEKDFAPGVHPVARNRSFADMSTRKHYAGPHAIQIKVNGEVKASVTFTLVPAG